MIERSIEIETPSGRMSTFVTHPEQDGPFPPVIIYMDIWGVREELFEDGSLAPGGGKGQGEGVPTTAEASPNTKRARGGERRRRPALSVVERGVFLTAPPPTAQYRDR